LTNPQNINFNLHHSSISFITYEDYHQTFGASQVVFRKSTDLRAIFVH